MARTSFGSGIGGGKVERIGDSRYGAREMYDEAEAKKTKEYYRKGDTLTVKEVKNPLLQTVKTVKAK
tara:strand:+ start:553 stop:753 length:201 start_codon:yes stop_codon:yes gene_type:complete